MKASSTTILLIGYFAFLSAGCGKIIVADSQETPTSPPVETSDITETQTVPVLPTQEDAMETEPSLPIPSIPGLPTLIEKAKEDLAQRLSIPSSKINTVEAKDVFWPDASLGCPQAGTTYDQVQVPGYLILLQANGDEFEYHANIHGHVFYCENPTPPILATPSNTVP